MSKHKKKAQKSPSSQGAAATKGRSAVWMSVIAIAIVAGVVIGATLKNGKPRGNDPVTNRPAATATVTVPFAMPTNSVPSSKTPETAALPPVMEINKAVMVTVDLDFGGRPPSIAEALRDIERRYQPDDGVGRTFAILDAYGEPTSDGSKLHMSMHVSTEKTGVGAVVFKRTGEVLWQSRITPPTNASARVFTGKDLLILVDGGGGKSFTIDGSAGPTSILKANLKELGQPLEQNWPDGTDREFTFLYSACGCPVKVMTRRAGNTTVRTSDLPVIFPDDPAVVQVISSLMGWK